MRRRPVPSLERIDTPEGLLVVHPEAPAGIPLDAIASCIERAGAVLSMLSTHSRACPVQCFVMCRYGVFYDARRV